MHRKYAKDGLVCLSVSVDDVKNQGKTLEFLKKVDAAFPNFLLNEEFEVWSEKWDIASPPAVFVFNRKNQRAAKFDPSDKPYTHEDVEKLVQKLLLEEK